MIEIKEVPKTMLVAMAIIAGIIIVFGLFPDLVLNNIIAPAANALVKPEVYINRIVGGVL